MAPETRVLSLSLQGASLEVTSGLPRPGGAAFLARLTEWGGVGAGLATLYRAAEESLEEPFVVAVGEAVRRGLPTAARATIFARAPLTGRLGWGQVGGELGARLAACADALVLRGRTELPGAVLIVEEGGACALQAFPELAGMSPVAASRLLTERYGAAALLVVGPAGERGVRFASLASEGKHPSFVGRGGLGAAFAKLGLKALVVRAAPVLPDTSSRARDLHAALTNSPRLAARSQEGTFELMHAHAVRGELVRQDGTAYTPSEAERVARDAKEQAVQRKGCRGCPTPCGWVFERSGGERQQAHFSAAEALGVRLGLNSFEDAIALLAICDELGMDAKEAGAVLGVLDAGRRKGVLEGKSSLGDRQALARDLRSILDPDQGLLRRGARAAADELGLEFATTRAEARGIERGVAASLGRFVSTGGTDPMRSFPFLLEAGGTALLERLLGDSLPQATLDPTSPNGKGRLVWWHENLVAAVDLTGFCAFSTAGLLADGLADLDRLADWILPEELKDPSNASWRSIKSGARLQAAGATVVLVRQMLDELYAPESATRSKPEDTVVRHALEEYAQWRGWGDGRSPSEAARRRLATPELSESFGPIEAELTRREPTNPGRALVTGAIELRATGALARALEGRHTFQIPLPCTVEEALHELARKNSALAPHLVHGDTTLPAAWRSGERLRPGDRVLPGDVLDLVTAIAGG